MKSQTADKEASIVFRNRTLRVLHRACLFAFLSIVMTLGYANEGAGLVGFRSGTTGALPLLYFAIALAIGMLFIPNGWALSLLCVASYVGLVFVLVTIGFSTGSESLLHIALYSPIALLIAQAWCIAYSVRQLENRSEPSEHSNICENSDLATEVSGRHCKQDKAAFTESIVPIQSLRILDATDVRKCIAKASIEEINLAQADCGQVSRFFNAIRYGETAVVREAVSVCPLLVLTRDAYGNSSIDAATQEKNSELLDFFKACLVSECSVLNRSQACSANCR